MGLARKTLVLRAVLVQPLSVVQFQVRMPFREATALVAVEREGVIDTRVLTLRGEKKS